MKKRLRHLLPLAAALSLFPRTGLGEDRSSHVRVAAPGGAIHVLRPAGFRLKGAGVVLYVHGFNTTVDRTFKEDLLGRQLSASRLNAVFIAVAGPSRIEDGVLYPSLREVLRLVSTRTGRLPRGPVVAVGHSGGYWTIASWLDHPSLERVILLDGMYGFAAEYRRWLLSAPGHRLVFVARATRRLSRRFIRGLPGAVTRSRVPRTAARFTRRERGARVLHIGSQYSHSGIVKSGKVIPAVLRLSGIGTIRR